MNDSAICLTLTGLVQGVGFRPFLSRLANRFQITGFARNTSGGLETVLSGTPAALSSFYKELKQNPPALSRILDIRKSEPTAEQLAHLSEIPAGSFLILTSKILPKFTFAGADTAPCKACERELFSPSDRRFGYPFINCTDCGPRYSIIKALPYDRSQTVMDAFPMCPVCEQEYHTITNRRFHAQPNCCPVCGPQAFLTDASGNILNCDPFVTARRFLSEGYLLAIKGTGGIHLACDASNLEAVARLRQRKKRPARPLALMARDLDAVRKICCISSEEEALLQSPQRPILLLSKKDPRALTDISFGSRIGVMLPYSPIHLLLQPPREAFKNLHAIGGAPASFDLRANGGVPASVDLLADGGVPTSFDLRADDDSASCTPPADAPDAPDLLVMTSANQKGCPVLTDNDQALSTLSGIADFFLLHNRPIQNRCDDSVAIHTPDGLSFFRRSRGYSPLPVACPADVSGIFAFGAEQKASFAIGRERFAFCSPHIGDLKNMETLMHYRQTLRTYSDLFQTTPSYLVCDLHPDYFSTQEAKRLAAEKNLPLLQVQHHWAHLVSCLADNRLSEPAFGIIWDGTGLGTDNTIWGAEFLIGDASSFRRVGSIRPIRLPGGDQATSQIWRTALSLLFDAQVSCAGADGAFDLQQLAAWFDPARSAVPDTSAFQQVLALLKADIACPKASSMGRLFDGVFALIGHMAQTSFDAEAPQRLEALCPDPVPSIEQLSAASPWPIVLTAQDNLSVLDTRPWILALCKELRQGLSPETIALHFQLSLCHFALAQCERCNPDHLPVVLSGGVFLNQFLTQGIRMLLTQHGFRVYTHHQVSCGDEGISLGQLAIAAASRKETRQPK